MIQIVEHEGAAEPVNVVVLPIDRPTITIDAIKHAVCRRYGISNTELIADRRSIEIVRPRQIAMYLARKFTHRSYPAIGRMFGGRNHATVASACERVEQLVAENEHFASDVADLEQFLSS